MESEYQFFAVGECLLSENMLLDFLPKRIRWQSVNPQKAQLLLAAGVDLEIILDLPGLFLRHRGKQNRSRLLAAHLHGAMQNLERFALAPMEPIFSSLVGVHLDMANYSGKTIMTVKILKGRIMVRQND